MSLFDVMAASHNGACFDYLGRKLQIPEGEAAHAVAALLPVLTLALDGWISQREGMVEFLNALGEEGYGPARTSASFFNDMRFRDRGVSLLRKWRDAGRLDNVALAEAASRAGLKPETTALLLPWLAVLIVAMVQMKAQRPLGWLARDIDGGDKAENPFLFLAGRLAGGQKPESRAPVRRMIGALLGLDAGGSRSPRTA